MAITQTPVTPQPQLIPTNLGARSFAAPPVALQQHIVPNELFFVRNHWKRARQDWILRPIASPSRVRVERPVQCELCRHSAAAASGVAGHV